MKSLNRKLIISLGLILNISGMQKIYKEYQNIDLKQVKFFTYDNNLLEKITYILGESPTELTGKKLLRKEYPVDPDLLNYIIDAYNKKNNKISCFHANLIVDSIMWILLIAFCENNTMLLRAFKVVFFFNSVSNFMFFFSQTKFSISRTFLYFLINISTSLLASLPEGTQMDNLWSNLTHISPLLLSITLGFNTLNFATWYYFYGKIYPVIYNETMSSFENKLIRKTNDKKLEAFIHKSEEKNNHMFMFLTAP